MSKRKYAYIQNILPKVQQMVAQEMYYREIAEHYGIGNEKVIRNLIYREKKRVAENLQLHSDQDFQYTTQAYFKLTQKHNITPSISRKGNCYDNAMAENFFSILKTECIYRNKPTTFTEANEMIDRYIYFYNHERIQMKSGMTPLM